MRKRLIIELDGDDFRSILAALLKTNADFKVENVEVEEEPVKRTVQRKTNEGQTASEVFIDALVEHHRVHKHEMANHLANKGFAHNTVYGIASKLLKDGLIRKDGDYYIEIKGKQ